MTTTATAGPLATDVEALTYLLDLLEHAPSNEQRARYLLSCNWIIERGAAAAENAADGLTEARNALAEVRRRANTSGAPS